MSFLKSKHFQTLSRFKPTIKRLSEKFLISRRMFLLGAGSFVGTIVTANRRVKAQQQEPPWLSQANANSAILPNATAHWTFDERDGNIARDSSRNGLDLQLFNNPQVFRDVVPFSNLKGRSRRFHDRSGQYASAASISKLNPEKRNFSVAFWFKIWNLREPGFLISKGNAISTQEGWSLFIGKVDGKTSLIWRVNSVPGELQRAGIYIPLDPDSLYGWHHVVAVIDRNEKKLVAYLNGEQAYDNRYSGRQAQNFRWTPLSYGNSLYNASIETDSLLVIAQREDGKFGFSGWIDDVRIYNGHALNLDQATLLASEDFLRFDDFTNKRLSNPEVRKYLSISPVMIPDESNTPEGNRHFGWPVAASLGEQIVVAYNRQIYHGSKKYDRERTNDSSSRAMIVSSNDSGKTWSQPVDISTIVATPNPPQGISDMHAIGVHDGKILYMCEDDGLFDYDGRYWHHLRDAYSINSLKGKVFPFEREPISGTVGPRIVNVGSSLCVFHSRFRNDRQNIIPPTFLMGVSEDGGHTWQQGNWVLPHPETFAPVEPTAWVYENRLILLARADGTTPDELIILVAKTPGVPSSVEFPFWEKKTNLKLPPEFRSQGLRGTFQDTGEIIFNHKTSKFEVLVTNRASNYPANRNEKPVQKMTLSLWSISPEDLINDSNFAEFKKECTLISRRHRKGVGAPQGYDGFHVGASIVTDKEQIIFFYSGYNKTGPNVSPGAGIFQMVRSLDTPSLVNALKL